jgi:heat shock protein HslJ
MVNTLSKAQLDGTWHLTHLAGGAIDASQAIQRPFLRFDAGRVSGKAAVNNISGSYTLSRPNKIIFGPMVSTMMAGSPEAMDLEQNFVEAIADVRSAGVLDQYLTLRDDSGKELIRMAREVEEPKGVSFERLKGEWVATLIQGTAASRDRTPTLLFEEPDRVAGHSGVNRFSGNLDSASLDDGAIRMGPFSATRMAGPPELMRQEQSFLAGLEQARTVKLSGGQLRLMSGETVLVTLRRR